MLSLGHALKAGSGGKVGPTGFASTLTKKPRISEAFYRPIGVRCAWHEHRLSRQSPSRTAMLRQAEEPA